MVVKMGSAPWRSRIREHAVAQLVEALRYKSEGRGFDSRWCQPLTEMSTRNISGGVKAAGAYGRPYHIHVPTVLKSGRFNILEPSGPVLGLLYLLPG